jgi:AcrR family transcriptional regulator
MKTTDGRISSTPRGEGGAPTGAGDAPGGTPDDAATEEPASDDPVEAPATPRRPRARRGEGPRLRDEILAAAERLLLTTGSSEAVSIRAVAEAVGVTPPSIYRHFPDKETLIFEVSARHTAVLGEELRQAVAGIADPVEALAARGRAYVRFGLRNPEPYRIMFMTRPSGTVVDLQEGWFQHSAVFTDALRGVQDCIDAGRLRPEHADAYRVCLGFWARVHGLTSLAVSKPFLRIDDGFIDEYIETTLYGIVAGPPP